jgi:hypothetical protein
MYAEVLTPITVNMLEFPEYLRGCWAGLLLRAPPEEPEPFWRGTIFFTEKQILRQNIWQGSSGGARARAGEEPYQTGSKCHVGEIPAPYTVV